MEQRKSIAELYAKLPKEKNLAYLEAELHKIIDQLTEQVEGLRKFKSYLDIDTDVKDPLEGDEMIYCADVVIDMNLDDMNAVSREDKEMIATNAASMLREKLDDLKNDLEWAMTKAASDAMKG